MNKIILSIAIALGFTAGAQDINIIPRPVELQKGTGSYRMGDRVRVACNFPDREKTELLSYLKWQLSETYGVRLADADKNEPADIVIASRRMPTGGQPAYELRVDRSGVRIDANFSNMAFYGIQTLLQLMPEKTSREIPYLRVFDYPRFGYRGMHLDVGRHFFPVSFIKKYIDYLAFHKMNYFHWHLTEDQGWRIEIKRYPELTRVGAWRNGTIIGRYPGKGNDEIYYGGFYTQDEIRQVVSYAAQRHITVVPEIEMPGHCSAAIASYPFLSCFPSEPTKIPANMISKRSVAEQASGRVKLVQETWGIFEDVFCAGKDSTFEFLQNVLDEVLELFPSRYIHIGGDECPKANWKRCPSCQKRIADNGLKDEHELQSYFVQRIEKYLNSKGRTLIGWDEILEGGLAPNAVVMSWRGEKGGIEAAKQNHDVIMTPGGWCYFDHSQSQNEDSIVFGGYTPVEKVYSYEPIPAVLTPQQGRHVLGAQGNVWTEYMKNTRKVEYQVFPRMSALSEVLWSRAAARNWADFEKRLITQFRRYETWGANYSTALFDLKATVIPTSDRKGVAWKLESKRKGARIEYMNEISPPLVYLKPVPVTRSQQLTATMYSGSEKLSSVAQRFHVSKSTGKKITLKNPPSQNYPGDGAFTLVNGVINDRGLSRGREFLGFLGTDCEAVIDLGKPEPVTEVKVRVLSQVPSWIWRPQYVEVFGSMDGTNYSRLGMTDDLSVPAGNASLTVQMDQAVRARYVKLVVKNWGAIPAGNPGAGTPAWLFVDEIEIH
ncbi:MAG TPA: family 20 glycosylhydrolase [Chitinophagaceae bacterium]|nr:family 20 glycosylhydrolase [Chitinophagaceae bacterium]